MSLIAKALSHFEIQWPSVTIGIVTTICFLPLAFNHPKKAEVCENTASGRLVPDRIVNGKVRFGSGSLYVQNPTEMVFVVMCPKGGCSSGLAGELYKYIGEPIRAEFCGTVVTEVFLNDKEIYSGVPPTQADLEGRSAALRTVFSVLIFIPLGLVFWSIFGNRKKVPLETEKDNGENI